MKKLHLSKEELSWSLYDVAASSFTLMLSTVIPLYMGGIGAAQGYTDAQTTTYWAILQSAATLVIALLAPVLGAMADYRGQKKKFFSFFFVLAVCMSALMAFADSFASILAVSFFTLIGYAGSNIFYDAFLIDVASEARMDFISSLGYALGYIGSCIPFILSLVLILLKPFGLTTTSATQIAFVINAIWWLAFTLPMLKNVKQKYGVERKGKQNLLRSSFAQMLSTLKKLTKDKQVGLFLLAYFFYIDGVDTIIKMSTKFGSDVGIDSSQLLLALLATQIIAFPAVLLCSRLVKRFSTKKIILFAVGLYFGICIFGFFLAHAWQFWVLAIAVALVQGTIQALSRSYFGKLIPNKENSNEYFGFYNIFGKYATIFGTALMAIFTAVFGDSRYGVLSIALLFVVGFVLLLKVPDVGSFHEDK